ALTVIWPLAAFVLKTRPQDIGENPDGLGEVGISGEGAAPSGPALNSGTWGVRKALATRQFRSHALAFGLGLMVQVGFVSHHVSIAIPSLGVSGAASAVFAAAV